MRFVLPAASGSVLLGTRCRGATHPALVNWRSGHGLRQVR